MIPGDSLAVSTTVVIPTLRLELPHTLCILFDHSMGFIFHRDYQILRKWVIHIWHKWILSVKPIKIGKFKFQKVKSTTLVIVSGYTCFFTKNTLKQFLSQQFVDVFFNCINLNTDLCKRSQINIQLSSPWEWTSLFSISSIRWGTGARRSEVG